MFEHIKSLPPPTAPEIIAPDKPLYALMYSDGASFKLNAAAQDLDFINVKMRQLAIKHHEKQVTVKSMYIMQATTVYNSLPTLLRQIEREEILEKIKRTKDRQARLEESLKLLDGSSFADKTDYDIKLLSN